MRKGSYKCWNRKGREIMKLIKDKNNSIYVADDCSDYLYCHLDIEECHSRCAQFELIESLKGYTVILHCTGRRFKFDKIESEVD